MQTVAFSTSNADKVIIYRPFGVETRVGWWQLKAIVKLLSSYIDSFAVASWSHEPKQTAKKYVNYVESTFSLVGRSHTMDMKIVVLITAFMEVGDAANNLIEREFCINEDFVR